MLRRNNEKIIRDRINPGRVLGDDDCDGDGMKLSRTTPTQHFPIRAPIWGGGKKIVGLNRQLIRKHNSIEFTYRRKSDGELSIPGQFYFDGDKLNQVDFENQIIKGTHLVLVPFDQLESLERTE